MGGRSLVRINSETVITDPYNVHRPGRTRNTVDHSTEPAVRQPMQKEIKFSTRWQFLPGMAYGLKQSVMVGSFQVAIDERFDFGPLDTAMEEIVIEQPPEADKGTSAAEQLAGRAAHWAVAIQRQNRIPLSHKYHVRLAEKPKGPISTWFVALPVSAPKALEAALAWVAETLNLFLSQDAIADESLALARESNERLKDRLRPFAMSGQNPIYIFQAALDSEVPVRPVADGILALGQGVRQRWLSSTISDSTSYIGVMLARDKVASAAVLRQFGLPVPTHGRALSPEQAAEVAARLGYPVVVKPTDQDQGRGVYSDLRDKAAVLQAFEQARRYSKNIIVEKHFVGDGHRLTVSHGRVVSATKKLPGGVTGDGIQTVGQLVEQIRGQPPKRELYAPVRPLLELDEEAVSMLAQQGLTPASVPESERFIALRRRNNATSGGVTIGLSLEQVHPDNIRLATRAAAALRLDYAGVDLLTPDISKSWLETGALICEVNAQPQMGRKAVSDSLSDLMVENGRIPVHLAIVSGADPRPTHVAVTRFAKKMGCDGVATADGVWIDNECLVQKPESTFHSARILLTALETKAAFCVMTAEDVMSFGLPTDYYDSVRLLIGTHQSANRAAIFTHVIQLIKLHTDQIRSVPALD